MKNIHRTTLTAIPELAKALAATLKGGEILALIGNLGTGKTTFTQHLAKQLRVKRKVTSPTFVIMNVFPAKLPATKQPVVLYHLDLYRTQNFREVAALGITELWGRKDTITVIEWANKIKSRLPKKTLFIYFN